MIAVSRAKETDPTAPAAPSAAAAWSAVTRPDVFLAIALMSAPFHGTTTLPFDTADDSLIAFLRNPTRDPRSGSRIDLKILRRLEDAAEEAATNLKQAEDVLADLDNDRDLALRERQASVAQAEADLAVARDNLSEVEDSVDQGV